ncbi:uncharacterized protein LOC112514813 isoform X2 [Cynara cardunculus var. scolymus]|uniref:uncharacterized protein LOC112514813 isoform X2 n=1 Tax=Cynara cardunculus var. scolymus TaxID=59895 RepID=UPI000D62639A|nr:uncharacterized protein LOC112514813 isoform X2 [Cynara cardunculus var. scolymus]
MADDEEPKAETLSLNTLVARERSQLPSVSDRLRYQFQSPLLSDPHGGGGRWSTPPMHDDHWTSIVFPPNNHEGLNLHHHNDDRETYKERARPLPPVSGGLKPEAMGGYVAVKWWVSHFKLPGGIFSCLWNFSVIRGGVLRLFNLPLVGSMVMLLLFYLRFRRRQRLRREAIDELLNVIKEKDEPSISKIADD